MCGGLNKLFFIFLQDYHDMPSERSYAVHATQGSKVMFVAFAVGCIVFQIHIRTSWVAQVAQCGERSPREQSVVGSNPT